MTRSLLALPLVLLLAGCRRSPDSPPVAPDLTGQGVVRFEKRVLTGEFLAEGVAVGDVNGDGKSDVVVGSRAFLAPDFLPQALTAQGTFDRENGYSDAFAVFLHDASGDGRRDAVVVAFPLGGAVLRQNPGDGGRWPEQALHAVVGTESPLFARLPDGHGPELVFSPGGGALVALGFDAGQVTQRTLATAPVSLPGHGLGLGDLTGDGQVDLLTTVGVFAGPSWRFLPANLGPDCAQLFAVDLDQDGKPEAVSSSAHDKGVFVHRQVAFDGGSLTFARSTIADDFSQSHSLAMGDLDADGRMDLVTGKRRYAHGPSGDVDPQAPAVLVWFRQTEAGQWERRAVDLESDSGVGTQFELADVDGDGLLDIATASKEGVFLFLQRR